MPVEVVSPCILNDVWAVIFATELFDKLVPDIAAETQEVPPVAV